MKRSIFRCLSIMIAAAATLSVSSCAQSGYRYSGDDLYSYHNIRLIEERDAAVAARERAEAEARQLRIEAAIVEAEATRSNQSYEDILVTDYETAYERRLRGFNSPTYRMPSSYYDFRYSSDYFLATSYDPAFYNVVVMGDEVWVEPRYISSMFGTWGAPAWNIGIGWNSRGGWNWGLGWGWNSWGWDPWWGWNSWAWNPWWSWNSWGWNSWGWNRPPHGPGWHRPPGNWAGPSNRPSTGSIVGGSPFRSNRPGSSTGIRQNSSGVVSGGSSSSGFRTSGTRYGTSTTSGSNASGVGTSTSSGNRATSGGTVSRTSTNRSTGTSSTGVSSGSSSRQNNSFSTPSRSSSFSAPSRSSGGSYSAPSGSSGSSGGSSSRTSGGRSR